jgi:hypothetical protein
VEEAVPAGKGRRVNLDYLSGDCLSASLGCPHAIQGVQDRAPGPRGATDRLQTAPDQIESLTSGGGWVGKDISCPGTRESYVGPPPRIIQIAAVLIFRWAATAGGFCTNRGHILQSEGVICGLIEQGSIVEKKASKGELTCHALLTTALRR